MDALQHHGPLTPVPMFFIVKLTAGRLPAGTVELAMKEFAELVARYPMASMVVTKSGKPVGTTVAGAVVVPMRYVLLVFSPAVVGIDFAGVGATCAELMLVEMLELASPNGIVVDAVGTTEREFVGAGVKTEPR